MGQSSPPRIWGSGIKIRGVESKHIKPDKAMQNGYIERFSMLDREAILDHYVLNVLEEVRYLTRE